MTTRRLSTVITKGAAVTVPFIASVKARIGPTALATRNEDSTAIGVDTHDEEGDPKGGNKDNVHTAPVMTSTSRARTRAGTGRV